MSKQITKSAKTVEEAIELALSELKLTKENAKITVVEQGSKGFLGIGAREAVVAVEPNIDLEGRAREFLNDVFTAMGLKVSIDITMAEKSMSINLSGDNMGIIIGKRGDTLDALEHLVSLALNKGDSEYIKVSLDTENYRQKRIETLNKLAENLAGNVVRNRKKVTLEPMSSNERRIIHSALQNNPYVDTYSVGNEPNRKIVIALKRKTNNL